MGYTLEQLSASTLKSIFDGAFIDSRVDDDGDCIVDDGLKIVVTAKPNKDMFKLWCLFGVSGSREQVLEFCNRYNNRLIMCRAQVRDRRDSDGDWVIIFDYDRATFEHEQLEPKSIVMLVRKFVEVVRGGIAKVDEDDLF